MVFIKEKGSGIMLHIHVIPKSARNEIVGIHDDALKLKISAPQIEGRANAECIRFISDILSIRKNQISILSGHKSKKKNLMVEGMSVQQAISIFKHRMA